MVGRRQILCQSLFKVSVLHLTGICPLLAAVSISARRVPMWLNEPHALVASAKLTAAEVDSKTGICNSYTEIYSSTQSYNCD